MLSTRTRHTSPRIKNRKEIFVYICTEENWDVMACIVAILAVQSATTKKLPYSRVLLILSFASTEMQRNKNIINN